MVLTGGWGKGGMRSCCLTGIELQPYKIKRVMGIEGSDAVLCCAVLCLVAQPCLFATSRTVAHQDVSVHGDSPGKDTGVGCHALLQGTFPTQGSNPGLPHCRRILYCLSYQGSPRILEWVVYPFSRGSSWPRNQTWVSCVAGRFFTGWATRKVPWWWWLYNSVF